MVTYRLDAKKNMGEKSIFAGKNLAGNNKTKIITIPSLERLFESEEVEDAEEAGEKVEKAQKYTKWALDKLEKKHRRRIMKAEMKAN
ncbi:MAG: hypothetical protein ABIH83_06105 [Candidatus Micrarchaeota archaeon]